MKRSLTRQLDLHGEINQILNGIPELLTQQSDTYPASITMSKDTFEKLDKERLHKLIHANQDALQYFYAKADERWLDWLWQNEFLDVIKQKPEDMTSYRYRTPELGYLTRMVEKTPEKVVDIMLKVQISTDTFNPEVVDYFLQICSKLSADQLARIIKKIRDERWIPLGGLNRFGSEYGDMFKTLAKAKDYHSLLTLAEAVLTLCTREEREKLSNQYIDHDPFYFHDLSRTKVFEYLANVSDEYTEATFELVVQVMSNLIRLYGEEKQDTVFDFHDRWIPSGIDFFVLTLGQKSHRSSRDNVRGLAAAIATMARRLMDERCCEAAQVQRIYERYMDSLPKSRAMWRLQLFVLSLCPEAFKDRLKCAFFRIFKVRHCNELISGTEYLKALQRTFSVLSEDEKRDYVRRVIEYFSQRDQEEKNQSNGSRILSTLNTQLTPQEKQLSGKAGFQIKLDYHPQPSIDQVQAGYIMQHHGPTTQEEFRNFSIIEIATKLRNEWAPEKLAEQNSVEDFFNPLNADGTGTLLRNDIPKRLQEYIESASNFFEREKLDPHYTYSFLYGIQETIKNPREDASRINWDGVVDLCIAIKQSGEKHPFERTPREHSLFNGWLVGWDAVHSGMADILKELFIKKNNSLPIVFWKYRDQIFWIISYLLSYPDPSPEDESPEDEQGETAMCKTRSSDNDDSIVGDPFTMAINTVRGRTFEAFVFFMYLDSKKVKEDEVKISDDVKDLYKSILNKETTRALMFMFGYRLPKFYFQDKEWIQGLLPQIFPQEKDKKSLYTAAWEGYLINNLYEEMFFDPEIQKLYERGLTLTNADYPRQEHFGEPDERFAVHLALAFIHCKNFGVGHPLFDAFWEKGTPKHHADFVEFLGRSYVIGMDENELLEKGSRTKEQLKSFWDWMLEDYEKSCDPFIQFSYWIKPGNEIFEPAWLTERIKKTLKKTNGELAWDFELIKSIVLLAKKAPKDTLEIIRRHLLEGSVQGRRLRNITYLDNEWHDALKILYENSETKSQTGTLINKLVHDGGKPFWGLKKIVDNNS